MMMTTTTTTTGIEINTLLQQNQSNETNERVIGCNGSVRTEVTTPVIKSSELLTNRNETNRNAISSFFSAAPKKCKQIQKFYNSKLMAMPATIAGTASNSKHSGSGSQHRKDNHNDRSHGNDNDAHPYKSKRINVNEEVLRHQPQHIRADNMQNHNKIANVGFCSDNAHENQKDNVNSNNCDIFVVDMEDDYHEKERPRPEQLQHKETKNFQQTHHIPTHLYDNNANIKNIKGNAKIIFDNLNSKETTLKQRQDMHIIVHNVNYQMGNSNAANIDDYDNDNDNDDGDDADDDDGDGDDDDSLASMETLSDNVSIWIDGEKHWISGVDANTTCAELIYALLNYQNVQYSKQQEITNQNANNIIGIPNSQQLQQQQQQQDSSSNNNLSKYVNHNNNQPNNIIINTDQQLILPNTKENSKTYLTATLLPATNPNEPPSSQSQHQQPSAATTIFQLPFGLTASKISTEFVIVRQYRHYEEYLDGSTKIFDVLPTRDSSQKKECELLLRRLGPAPVNIMNSMTVATAVLAAATTPQMSSLISTDKDSGMGSPVGSARSAKFRRRKHKSSQWLAQANTLHPKLSRSNANERLMKIILAQDETIQRQLSLLREKEKQIAEIEEEKHRKRERELGKNYLLETYLNGLDEAECGEQVDEQEALTATGILRVSVLAADDDNEEADDADDGEEIFIDESYSNYALRPVRMLNSPGNSYDKQEQQQFNIKTLTEENLKAKEKILNKKEKKKKKHKDKAIANEEYKRSQPQPHSRKFEKEEKRQQTNAQIPELKANAEIEMQIFWLEKVYTLNKQLQREEEVAARLHAKIRKQQLRKVENTQKDVQMEVDKLDNVLALQCTDIRKVQSTLMETNDQLQKKLALLERLSVDYLNNEVDVVEIDFGEENKDAANTNWASMNSFEKSSDIQKLSQQNINSIENDIEKIIMKPRISSATTKRQSATGDVDVSQKQLFANKESDCINIKLENNQILTMNNSNKNIADSFKGNNNNTTTLDKPLEPRHIEIAATAFPPAETANIIKEKSLAAQSVSLSTHSAASSTLATTMSQSNMFIDKNMLSHVQNAKNIKKQMFNTQKTPATTLARAAAAAAAAGDLKQTTTLNIQETFYPLVSNHQQMEQWQQQQQSHPEHQQQQYLHHHHSNHQHLQQMQFTLVNNINKMPMAAATNLLASRPSSAYNNQIFAETGVVSGDIMASAPATTYPATAAISSTTSSALISTPNAIVSVASPTPSLMQAMNTVDITQLGTLV